MRDNRDLVWHGLAHPGRPGTGGVAAPALGTNLEAWVDVKSRVHGERLHSEDDFRTAVTAAAEVAASHAPDAPRARVAAACAAAESELRAVDALFSAGCDGPPVCAALTRARHAVADLGVALHGEGAAAKDEREASRFAALDAQFSDIEIAAHMPSSQPQPWPTRQTLHRARHRLVERLEALRREASPRLARRRSRRELTALAVLAAALGAGVAFAIRPPVWRVQYFPSTRLVDPVASDLTLDVGGNWGEGSPHDGVPRDNFASRWESCMVLQRPVEIDFRLESDDGSRLAVDDTVVIEQWREQRSTTVVAHVHLAAGTHSLRVEHFEKGGLASLSLRAQFDDRGGFRLLPRSLLRAPRPGPVPCPL